MQATRLFITALRPAWRALDFQYGMSLMPSGMLWYFTSPFTENARPAGN